jgi:transposase-like protein
MEQTKINSKEEKEEWKMRGNVPARTTLRQVRNRMRWQYSAEEKVRLVLKSLIGTDSIADLCRKEGINQTLFCLWRNQFFEAGGADLIGDQWEYDQVDVSTLVRMKKQLRDIVSKMDNIEKNCLF